MATIKLTVRGKRNPSEISARFVNGREVDITAKTNVFVNPVHWDHQKGTYRNISEIQDRSKKSLALEKLKIFIMDRHNEAYMSGEVIDKYWLTETIKSHFNRPKQEKRSKTEDHYIYYIDFAEWWLKEIAPSWRTEKHKFLSYRAIQQYETFIKAYKNFEGKKKYRIKDIDAAVINDFINHICDAMKYSPTTAKRLVGRFKFFLNRAEKLNISVNVNFKERVYVQADEDDILAPYLNEEEIKQVFDLDLSHDVTLDNIRDSFIIALWTGLRISDFNKNLDINNIEGDFINIKTKKTGNWVSIPLHPHIKHVLKKRFGNLPVKYSDKHFNEHIKTVCMLAKIDEEIKGKLFDSGKKRKVKGSYKKWKLISSHTGRRSFATNLHGIISNHIIMDCAGWKSEGMMLRYIKRTKKESAEQLKQHWDEKYK